MRDIHEEQATGWVRLQCQSYECRRQTRVIVPHKETP
jgi:hypothetical protein